MKTFQYTIGTNSFVMAWGMMLSKLIGLIMRAFIPFNVKLGLRNTITQPVVLHIPRFGSFYPHLRVYKAGSSGIISFDHSFCLGMAKTNKGSS